MSFEHDKLLAHILHVNPRSERHGEEDVLACDIKARLMKAENEEAWPRVIRSLCQEDAAATTRVEAITDWVVALPFLATFSEHKVNFWQGNRKPASLAHAKINKCRWASEDGAQFIDIRIQAQSNGEAIGAISELIGHKLRLECVNQQQELDLNSGDDDDDPDAENS